MRVDSSLQKLDVYVVAAVAVVLVSVTRSLFFNSIFSAAPWLDTTLADFAGDFVDRRSGSAARIAGARAAHPGWGRSSRLSHTNNGESESIQGAIKRWPASCAGRVRGPQGGRACTRLQCRVTNASC